MSQRLLLEKILLVLCMTIIFTPCFCFIVNNSSSNIILQTAASQSNHENICLQLYFSFVVRAASFNLILFAILTSFQCAFALSM